MYKYKLTYAATLMNVAYLKQNVFRTTKDSIYYFILTLCYLWFNYLNHRLNYLNCVKVTSKVFLKYNEMQLTYYWTNSIINKQKLVNL